MRSIYAKILLWAVVTIALSTIGFIATFWYIAESRPGREGFFTGILTIQLEGAQRALHDGGPKRLVQYLARLEQYFGDEHFLVDRDGRDQVDGADRSALLARSATPPEPLPRPGRGRPVMASPPGSDGMRLLVVLGSRFSWTETLPYYLWILLLVLGLIYALAVHLVRPLRRLQRAVDRFGQGDLTTRIGMSRRDEIGELARAFDVMAHRIESLLAAERRLIQDVSHELRSPLTRLGLAIRLGRSGDREIAMDRIKKEADRLSNLVDELLRLNSAEEDPLARHHDEVRLGELLTSLVDDCAVESEAKGGRLNLRVDALATTWGDRELLRRALENVIRNAVRHSPESMPVEIELRVDADCATITVRDYGGGVPDGSLTAIFKPFFRIDDDRSRSSGGSGLGLAIAERAVTLHGGTIAAVNAEPGLVVTIQLPVAQAADLMC